MGLILVTPPAIEPLTVHEVATHLRLGSSNTEPAPDAPSVALAGLGAGNVDTGAHRYRVTFVTADGETDGGTLSDVVTVADAGADGQVALTNIPLGGSAVTARKIYRTAAGGSTYLLVATIADNAATTYTDNTADASLGAEVPADNTTGDPELRRLIRTARRVVESHLERPLITQTWRYTLDHNFPCGDTIELPKPSLLTVASIGYVDSVGEAQTLDPASYTVDTTSFPGRIVRHYGIWWPQTRCQRNAVTIEFTCGFGPAASDVPEDIIAAMLLECGHLYENRESVGSNTLAQLPRGFEALLAPHRFLEAA